MPSIAAVAADEKGGGYISKRGIGIYLLNEIMDSMYEIEHHYAATSLLYSQNQLSPQTQVFPPILPYNIENPGVSVNIIKSRPPDSVGGKENFLPPQGSAPNSYSFIS